MFDACNKAQKLFLQTYADGDYSHLATHGTKIPSVNDTTHRTDQASTC